MNISNVKPEDIVYCDVRGNRFYAIVEEPAGQDKSLKRRVMRVSPLSKGPIPTRFIGAREVVSHWRKSRQAKA